MNLNSYIRTFNNRLEARKKLAEEIGVSEITVRSWANGNRHPGRKHFSSIVKATNGMVTLGDLAEQPVRKGASDDEACAAANPISDQSDAA